MALKPLHVRDIERVLIRSTNWIGDAIMTTPAIGAIRKNFPRTEISILAKPWVIPVFTYSPDVDRILTYDSTGRHSGFSGKLRLAGELKKDRYETAILLQNAFEAALITFIAGIPCRIGYNTDIRGPLLTHAVRMTPEIRNQHQTAYYLNILKSVGLETDGQGLVLEVGEKYADKADEMLRLHGIRPGDRFMGINPGATYGPAKQWFPDRYAELADRVHKRFGVRIIIFGGPQDLKLGVKISEMMRHPPINLCGKTELAEAMALIDRCSLFITNDSGLMHVAAALNVPLIAIFGSTNPITTGPWSATSRIVRIPIECSPCLKPECPKMHFNCMKRIDVDMVFEVVKEVLG